MPVGDLQRENDSPLGSRDYRAPVDPSDTPENGDVFVWDAAKNALVPSAFLSVVAVVGYGGVRNPGGGEALPDITSGFQTIPFDTITVAEPISIIQDLVGEGLHFERLGVWVVNLTLTLEYVDINAGRTFDVRLFNATEATVLRDTPVFAGRNIAGTNYSATVLFEITEAFLDDLIVVQLGNASVDFTTVTLEAASFIAWHVGPISVIV